MASAGGPNVLGVPGRGGSGGSGGRGLHGGPGRGAIVHSGSVVRVPAVGNELPSGGFREPVQNSFGDKTSTGGEGGQIGETDDKNWRVQRSVHPTSRGGVGLPHVRDVVKKRVARLAGVPLSAKGKTPLLRPDAQVLYGARGGYHVRRVDMERQDRRLVETSVEALVQRRRRRRRSRRRWGRYGGRRDRRQRRYRQHQHQGRSRACRSAVSTGPGAWKRSTPAGQRGQRVPTSSPSSRPQTTPPVARMTSPVGGRRHEHRGLRPAAAATAIGATREAFRP